jgi:hypothetical protein
MGDRTQCRVAADSRRSTDLIQAIRVPVGRGVVAAVGAGAGAGPMYLLDPDLGASPAGSDRESAVISTYAVRELYLLTGLATELVGSVESRHFRLSLRSQHWVLGALHLCRNGCRCRQALDRGIPGDISHQI